MTLNISLSTSVGAMTGSSPSQRADRRPPELDALASKLGVDVDTLDQAFKSAMDSQNSSGSRPDKSAVDASVARTLNIDISTLQSAMKAVGSGQHGPGGPGGPPPGGPPPDAGARMQQVADKLGVSSDDLESAFQTALDMLESSRSTSSTTSTSSSADSTTSTTVDQLFANVAQQLSVRSTDLINAMREAGGRRVDQRV